MAKFFKFKDADALQFEAERIGAPIRLSTNFESLCQPLVIAGRTVGNRLVIQPMEGCDGRVDGSPDELTVRRFRRFGGGGAKIIWGEATAVTMQGQANPRQLHINDANVGLFRNLVEVCRRSHREAVGNDDDLLVGLQLTHSGRFSFRQPILAQHCPVLDPRTVVDRRTGQTAADPYPLIGDDELQRLADAYLKAARLAFSIGFDFIDLKQCHRYLLSELLASKTRPGIFGGSLENRMRFALGVVERIRAEIPSAIIATRVNAYDGIPYRKGEVGIGEPCPFTAPYRTGFGTDEHDPLADDLREPLEYFGKLRSAGVALINISLGSPYFNPHVVRPAEYPPIDGYDAPEHPLLGVGRHLRIARTIQQAYPDLPVVGSGYSYLQEFLFHAAAANVQAGDVALVGIGRAALAYPHAVRDLLETGRLDRKSVCRTFSYCTNLMRSKHHPLGQFATGCPPFDKEVYMPIWKEALATRGDASAAPMLSDESRPTRQSFDHPSDE